MGKIRGGTNRQGKHYWLNPLLLPIAILVLYVWMNMVRIGWWNCNASICSTVSVYKNGDSCVITVLCVATYSIEIDRDFHEIDDIASYNNNYFMHGYIIGFCFASRGKIDIMQFYGGELIGWTGLVDHPLLPKSIPINKLILLSWTTYDWTNNYSSSIDSQLSSIQQLPILNPHYYICNHALHIMLLSGLIYLCSTINRRPPTTTTNSHSPPNPHSSTHSTATKCQNSTKMYS